MKATPTAAPSTIAISLPQPLVITASPVCNPGCPVPVPVDPAPAVPDGVCALPPPAPITVTAVMVDCCPLGRVLVWTSVEVSEERVAVFDEDLDGETVLAPPPTVEMTVTPTLLVVVMTWPAVSDAEEEEEEEEAEEAVAPAEVIDAVSEGVALPEVIVDGASEVVVDDSPPSGTGVTRVGLGSCDSCAEVVIWTELLVT